IGRGRPRKLATTIPIGNIMEASNSQSTEKRIVEVVNSEIKPIEQWPPLTTMKEALNTMHATSPVVINENEKVNSADKIQIGGSNQGRNDMQAKNKRNPVEEIVRN
ncbi:hypothetical protein A4A49_60097, partial [Nicotiana attenuata]